MFSLLPSPTRVFALAGVTLTQLVRMRLFLVLAVFCLGFLALQFLPFHERMSVEFSGIHQLELIKNIAMGCMQLFGLIFSVAATALLIPRDAEDRILYTILCKPVPRFDYLLGKALGVVALLLIMLLSMDGLMCLILYFREAALADSLQQMLAARNYAQVDIDVYLEGLSQSGATWNLQRGLIAMFLGWVVLTGMTLLLSCFTSGTIVSMVFALAFYFVGMFQGQFFDALALGSGMVGVSAEMQMASQIFAVMIPDFGLYTAGDATSAGVLLSWSDLGRLGLLAGGYFLFHLLLSTWLFSRKEF